jgi:alkylation response protein AidB-like acyl-CoA dehydrogenase
MTSSSTPVVVRPPLRPEPLGTTTEERLATLPEIIDTLRRDDAERDRVLQHHAIDALLRAGVLNLRFLARYGGPGGSVRDVLTAVIEIARGSSNVAQALQGNFWLSELL